MYQIISYGLINSAYTRIRIYINSII